MVGSPDSHVGGYLNPNCENPSVLPLYVFQSDVSTFLAEGVADFVETFALGVETLIGAVLTLLSDLLRTKYQYPPARAAVTARIIATVKTILPQEMPALPD